MTKSVSRAHWMIDIPTIVVWLFALATSAFFIWFVGDLFWHGSRLVSLDFLTMPSLNSGRDGGIAPILISTGLILAVCLTICVPLGGGTAIYLAEFAPANSRFGYLVRRSLDLLAGVPSIVFGLFGFALFVQAIGLGFSIASGGLTLACMVLPITIRTAEEGFRSIPSHYRLGAASLGLSRVSILKNLLIPAAMPGLLAGLVLGIGRAMAETAALLYTSGYVDRTPASLLDSGRSLSIHIFDLAMNVPGGEQNAYGSAVVLICILFIINITASWITSRFQIKND